jgi:hypothetical protein
MMHHLQVGAESSWLVEAGAATILFAHIGGGIVGILVRLGQRFRAASRPLAGRRGAALAGTTGI